MDCPDCGVLSVTAGGNATQRSAFYSKNADRSRWPDPDRCAPHRPAVLQNPDGSQDRIPAGLLSTAAIRSVPHVNGHVM